MNIVYFGTPAFSVPSLKALLEAGHNIKAVVTKPEADRRAVASPIKTLAEALSLRVIQPHSIRTPEFILEMRDCAPDVIVVTAYGKILPSGLLKLPPLGCINVHASVLPNYRGAAPIQRAIIAGERETGVTTMLMDEGVDTGAVFLIRKTAIDESDTANTLTGRLAALGADLLIETLTGIERGTLKAVAQEGVPSYAPPIGKEDCRILWLRPARDIVNLIRGLCPVPGAFTFINGQRVKILRGAVSNLPNEDHRPGDVVRKDREGLLIAAAGGIVSIEELQPEGKRPMSYREYLRGRVNSKEEILHVG
ncbi:MAG: methionyl-tRNA formyltransferase [Nitrospirae bacterium]|nr:methionyl-tRNA formyltransferase [Nitrospirota bacterium]